MKTVKAKLLFLFAIFVIVLQSQWAQAESRCTESWWRVKCDRNTTLLYTGSRHPIAFL